MKNLIKNLIRNQYTPLTLFILSGILSDALLRALTLKEIFYWKPIAASMAILTFLSIFPLLMNYRRMEKIFTVLSFFVAVLSSANYLYYKHFDSFISFSIIHQVQFLGKMAGSVSSTLDIKVLLFLIPPMGFVLGMKKLKKINYFNKMERQGYTVNLLRPLSMGILCLLSVLMTLTSTDYSRLVKQWNRPYLLQNLGVFSYTIADAVKSAVGPSTVLAQLDDEVIEEYVDNLIDSNTDKDGEEQVQTTINYKDIFKGRDVYVIHYESAQTFARDLEYGDGAVTPFLNKMAEEGLSFNNFYPQHSVGTSSDSEFTFNTSLYPINNGTVFMSHFDREFLTLQHLLKDEGYFSVSMHGNNGDFWNRNVMHQTLGYDNYFSKNDYIIDEEIGLGLSDKSFFRQSVEKIKNLKAEKGKVIATLITLTNHYPFDDVEKYGQFGVGHLEGTVIGNYLKSYHYADTALESFITQMDEEGLLDNAVVVLYGDHHAQIPAADYELLYNYNPLTDGYYTAEDSEYTSIENISRRKIFRTPFIIWTKDRAVDMEVNTPMGMVDALPTLGNMLGVLNEYQLGTDVMNTDENRVIFPDGSWIDDSHYYSASSTTYYDLLGNQVEEDDILLSKTHEVEEKLLLSNTMLNGDVIRMRRESKIDNHNFTE